MRYLIKFTKDSSIKFVSHLDLMRTIQRIVRRAELPVKYSQGFNPHMNLSIAQPLSVGVYSQGEYMDIELLEVISTDEFIEKFNSAAPQGIRAVEAITIEFIPNTKKAPQAMAALDAASYKIKMKYDDVEFLGKEIKTMLSKDSWDIVKKSKKGEKLTNIKPLVKKFEYEVGENVLYINCIIACGSKENLSAELLSNFIKENTSNSNNLAFVDVERIECLMEKGKKYIPLIEALK
ncbi:MAG: TIGR03936 family radical SAM-associated protein [Clostridiaceae bacterium]